MKKQLAATAAAALALTGACAFGGTALADEDIKNMDVTYNVASTFTLNIPSTVTLTETGPTTAAVGVTSANIAPNYELKVTVDGDGFGDDDSLNLTHEDRGDVKATTHIKVDDKSIGATDIVATFDEGVTGEQTVDLIFDALVDAQGGSKVQAGSYKTVLTFTGAIQPMP